MIIESGIVNMGEIPAQYEGDMTACAIKNGKLVTKEKSYTCDAEETNKDKYRPKGIKTISSDSIKTETIYPDLRWLMKNIRRHKDERIKVLFISTNMQPAKSSKRQNPSAVLI